MSGDAWQRLMAGRQPGAGDNPPDDAEDVIAPSFGFMRGMRERSIMFEIRHRDGRATAFTYSLLDQATFDPSEGIILHFGRNQVRLTGRNLNAEVRPNLRLFDSILRHRVPWVSEADEPTAMSAGRGAVVIESVVVQ